MFLFHFFKILFMLYVQATLSASKLSLQLWLGSLCIPHKDLWRLLRLENLVIDLTLVERRLFLLEFLSTFLFSFVCSNQTDCTSGQVFSFHHRIRWSLAEIFINSTLFVLWLSSGRCKLSLRCLFWWRVVLGLYFFDFIFFTWILVLFLLFDYQ